MGEERGFWWRGPGVWLMCGGASRARTAGGGGGVTVCRWETGAAVAAEVEAVADVEGVGVFGDDVDGGSRGFGKSRW